MNHEIYATYRQAEGIQACIQYDQLDEIQPVKHKTGPRGYSLDFYVSSPGTDLWPAIITIDAMDAIAARRIIREVRNKIRLDVAPKCRIEK